MACIKYYNTTTQTWENASSITNLDSAHILNQIHPIGSIYLSTSEISPASIFGGSWEQIEDVFLLGAGAQFAANEIGGEATHTLTIDEIPSHYHTSHGINIATTGNQVNLALRSTILENKHTGDVEMRVASTGGGLAHNNMPPYLTVYMWKRIE